MKKLIMLAVAAMFATVNVNAQTAGEMYIKPMVGGTLSTLTGDTEGAKMRFGFVGGAEFGYNISNQFAVTAGLLASMQGASYKDTNYTKDASTTLTYLNVPILANYYLAPGLAIKAGIQPGFLLSAKSKGTELEGTQWVKYDESGTSGLKKVDISIPLGLSYEFDDIVIDARYNLGLTKINDYDLGKVKNGVIMLTVGYKIPL